MLRTLLGDPRLVSHAEPWFSYLCAGDNINADVLKSF